MERTLVTTVFPPNDDMIKNLINKNLNILGKSPTKSGLHDRQPMLAYRRPLNLKNQLVRAYWQLRDKNATKPKQNRQFLLKISRSWKPKPTKQPLIVEYFSKIPLVTSSNSLTNCTNRSETPLQTQSLTNIKNRSNLCTYTKF